MKIRVRNEEEKSKLESRNVCLSEYSMSWEEGARYMNKHAHASPDFQIAVYNYMRANYNVSKLFASVGLSAPSYYKCMDNNFGLNIRLSTFFKIIKAMGFNIEIRIGPRDKNEKD